MCREAAAHVPVAVEVALPIVATPSAIAHGSSLPAGFRSFFAPARRAVSAAKSSRSSACKHAFLACNQVHISELAARQSCPNRRRLSVVGVGLKGSRLGGGGHNTFH